MGRAEPNLGHTLAHLARVKPRSYVLCSYISLVRRPFPFVLSDAVLAAVPLCIHTRPPTMSWLLAWRRIEETWRIVELSGRNFELVIGNIRKG